MTGIHSHGKRVTYNLWSYVTLFLHWPWRYVFLVSASREIVCHRAKNTRRGGAVTMQRFRCIVTVFPGAVAFGAVF